MCNKIKCWKINDFGSGFLHLWRVEDKHTMYTVCTSENASVNPYYDTASHCAEECICQHSASSDASLVIFRRMSKFSVLVPAWFREAGTPTNRNLSLCVCVIKALSWNPLTNLFVYLFGLFAVLNLFFRIVHSFGVLLTYLCNVWVYLSLLIIGALRVMQ